MNEFFLELLEYSHHYNQRTAEEFQKAGADVPERSLKLFSHLISAHHIWNARIGQKQPEYQVWHQHAPSLFAQIDQDNYEATKKILQTKDLGETITYATSQAMPFSNTIRDILFHVINHSTYHRAQIASDLKQHGLQPLTTDYIFYKR